MKGSGRGARIKSKLYDIYVYDDVSYKACLEGGGGVAALLKEQKICYDKAGNLPNKGRNFNTKTWGKMVYFLFL